METRVPGEVAGVENKVVLDETAAAEEAETGPMPAVTTVQEGERRGGEARVGHTFPITRGRVINGGEMVGCG